MEHSGIKVQFIGSIEMFFDRGTHYEFLSLVQELAAPGEMRHPQTFNFEFKNVEKQHESYHGINVKLRYFIRVIITRRMPDIVGEKDIWVYSYKMPPENTSSIKMDVGIEDCLHIEFEYSKSRYHLKDVIVGKIHFLLVRLKIKYMELSIIRRETTGSSPNQYNESETISRFEIMDGQPARGETIPIRLFLGGFDLTPTFRDVNKKFSTRYYLSLVLIDEDARRYFKQSEITLKSRKHADTSSRPFQVSNIQMEIVNAVSDNKNNIKSEKQGYSLTNEKDIQKTKNYINHVNLRDIAAHAAEERLEKSKNRGISAPGKLSAQLEAEKKKTRTMLLDDIIKEKQIERNLKQTDLQWN
ncbi:retromer subunit PEP8 [Pneumocystis jirovecii RU7]|uniref:Vacuolar protein sorting-associated protein 26 n=1 Tax=Pneumocystis jirovecii (strain RU7) TaxID=1408657 RepID=A0A0W4ZNW3_PNEJ7|nr:retromer subunit PEP8 [Pneumocystis jirovecii RU7]KTW30071.1 hypothetical protein T551_02015 [Pneumocystis jirovecii RU7]